MICCFRLLSSLATLIYWSPSLTLISLILLPISAFVISRIGKSLKRTAKQGQEQMGILLSSLEENFGGTFDGGISQFRFYTEPLSAPEVKHNFKLLKDTFMMFDPDCPVCTTVTCAPNDFTYEISDVTTTTTTSNITTTTTTSGSTGRVSFTLG